MIVLIGTTKQGIGNDLTDLLCDQRRIEHTVTICKVISSSCTGIVMNVLLSDHHDADQQWRGKLDAVRAHG